MGFNSPEYSIAMRIFLKVIGGIYYFLLEIIIGLISLVEAPIFLIINYKIFKNKILYVFWIWSFGHTVLGLDYASRLYYPHRLSLIYIPHPSSNSYLPLCFKHNVDAFIYKSLIPFQESHVDVVRYRILRFFLLLISSIFQKFHVIEHFNIYKTLSLGGDNLLMCNEKDQIEKATDWTGYIRLLRENVGNTPHLPSGLVEKCKNAITIKHPKFFDKPFVTLLLREKGHESKYFSNAVRCAGPHENYIPAVKFFTQNGYNVVGAGETKHEYFKNIAGYYSFEEIGVPKKLLNIFLLMNCNLFIGQHSGPFTLPDSCGIMCLICDSMHYRIGTFHSRDIILFKHLRNRATGNRLSYVDVFKNHQDLAYGCHFKEKKIDIEPNSAEEILEAAKECCDIIHGQFKLSEEDKRLCDRFIHIYPKGMAIAYAENRTSMHMLRQLKSQLNKDESNEIVQG